MITYRKGNLFNDTAPVWVNTVNLDGVMGKGIALGFRQAFPNNYAAYVKACAERTLSIGKLLIVADYSVIYGARTIVNFPTKVRWQYPSEYTYIVRGLSALREYLIREQVRQIAMPAIGCGNGRLDWNKVKRLIDGQLVALATEITVYEP